MVLAKKARAPVGRKLKPSAAAEKAVVEPGDDDVGEEYFAAEVRHSMGPKSGAISQAHVEMSDGSLTQLLSVEQAGGFYSAEKLT